MAVGIRCADHVTASARKFGTSFSGRGGRSGGIVRFQPNSHGAFIFMY
jgi:hypothetical protein